MISLVIAFLFFLLVFYVSFYLYLEQFVTFNLSFNTKSTL